MFANLLPTSISVGGTIGLVDEYGKSYKVVVKRKAGKSIDISQTNIPIHNNSKSYIIG